MAAAERLSLLAEMANFELREHILPYWYQTMDRRAGGFAGLVNDDGTCDFQQPKGVVMHSRHLWASSAAYLERRNPLDLAAATHAARPGPAPTPDHRGRTLSALRRPPCRPTPGTTGRGRSGRGP